MKERKATMQNEEKSLRGKWIVSTVILISVAMVCLTVLVIGFKGEIKEYLTKLEDEQTEKKTKKQRKLLEEQKKAKRYLQFTEEEKTRLRAKQGQTSISDFKIHNVPFAILGKLMPSPIPTWCINAHDETRNESLKAMWDKYSYDAFAYEF